MKKEAFNVTIFFKPNTHNPVKYRNVTNLQSCVNYCTKNFGIVYYVNLYDPLTKQFIRREWQMEFKK
jgi:hypothetical protein